MTIVVGIYCKDGIVIAADSCLTIGDLIEQKYSKKITDQCDTGLLTGFAGDLGYGQRIRQTIKDVWEDTKTKPNLKTHDLINAFSISGIQEFYKTNMDDLNIPTSFFIGFVHKGEHHLISLPDGTFQPTVLNKNLWYSSLGSGSDITFPLLGFIRQVFWKDECPSLSDGIFAAVMCIQLAIEINAGGIQAPVHIGVIEKHENNYTARKLSGDEVSEHLAFYKEALEYFGKYSEVLKNKKAAPIPKQAKPAKNKSGKK